MVWMKGKLAKQMQLRPSQSTELGDFERLQRVFFVFGLVDKLMQIHTLRTETDLKREIIGLITLLCKDSPSNVTSFLHCQNFIVASFYE